MGELLKKLKPQEKYIIKASKAYLLSLFEQSIKDLHGRMDGLEKQMSTRLTEFVVARHGPNL